jgi:hypothetical protein
MANSAERYSPDQKFRARLTAFASNYLFYRQIGAMLETQRKTTKHFLFITYDTWEYWPLPGSTLLVTYTSAPDPASGVTTTRSALVRNTSTDAILEHLLWAVGFSLSMDADASISGAPDPETTRLGPNAPSLPVKSVLAVAHVAFPDGTQVALTADDHF